MLHRRVVLQGGGAPPTAQVVDGQPQVRMTLGDPTDVRLRWGNRIILIRFLAVAVLLLLSPAAMLLLVLGLERLERHLPTEPEPTSVPTPG